MRVKILRYHANNFIDKSINRIYFFFAKIGLLDIEIYN